MRVLCVLLWLFVPFIASAQSLDLSQLDARFYVGDDPSFSDADLDDSGWQVQPSIEPGGWLLRGAGPFEQVMWERIRIPKDALPDLGDPALYIGVMSGAHAVYFNGVLVGQMGLYQPAFAGLHSIGSKAMPRVYALPKALFSGPEDAVLAIKMARYVADDPGVVAGPFVLTEKADALARAEALTLRFLLISAIGTFLTLVATGIVVFAYLFASQERGLGWLALTMLFSAPQAVLSGAYFLHISWLPPALLSMLAVKCVGAAGIFFCQAAYKLIGAPVSRLARTLQIMAIVALLLPNYGTAWLEGQFIVFAYIWFAMATVLYAVTSVMCITNALRGKLVAIPLSAAFMTFWAGFILTLFTSENAIMARTGASMVESFTFIFSICLAAIPIMLLSQTRRELVLAQSEVLAAQENERRRVAYDIHDGVGQWLSTIKLNLQILRTQHSGTAAESGLTEVVGHVDEAISDTRRIAHDLSPAMIEKQGLFAAIRSHTDLISRRSQVEVDVMIDSDVDLPTTTQGHLYRIFQEALTNAIKHGRATKIAVELRGQPAGFQMEITDNGTGLNPDKHASGLGLRSMRQRALLFGAEISIENIATGGTQVRLKGKSRPNPP